MLAVGKRCFVSNLAWKTSWQDLKDKFREVGNVVYANVHQTEDGAQRLWPCTADPVAMLSLHAGA